jgi:hypothetical protein
MKLRLVSLLVLLVAAVATMRSTTSASPASASTQPERKVSGQTITSTHDPAVRITFPHDFKYLGAVRWPLYDLADAELHIFVDAGPDKRVRRYYWVQFEQYLPSRPYAKHDYSGSEARAQFAGWDWYVDADVAHYPYKPKRPDSDGAHARRLLTDQGYTFPEATGQLRLVHLTDASLRKELMIIYEEDLSRLGVKASAVEDPKATGHATFRDLLLDRAKNSMKVEPQ